jgi:2-hydroxychromene-2-carboxylate isomerase
MRLNCGAFFAFDRALAERYVSTAWRLVWGEGGAMDSDALLAATAESLGWNAAEFIAYTTSEPARDRLAASNAQALERGVFGVPTMSIGDELWWGNDRLHFLEQHLQARAGTA